MKHNRDILRSVFWTKSNLFLAAIGFFLFFSISTLAQNDSIIVPIQDTSRILNRLNDSIIINLADTITSKNQTNPPPKSNKNALKSKVVYSATDSVILDLEAKKVLLYKDADIKYEKIQIKAGFVSIDFNTSILTALPLKDSVGKEFGIPEFTEGDRTFKSKEMRYNFETKQGFIKGVITQEGQGYLHGEVVKKMANDINNMRGGAFTTCNLEHPHFSLRFTKAKVIPNNKIVTGPAFMEIEGVPIPLILPFGMFPNKRGQTSGIIIPSYGESRDRGFYLNNGGYYFGINDYMELRLVGDIYSRGSWAVKPQFNYRKRYKFSGNFNMTYAINVFGVKETNSYQRNRDFNIKWYHKQDPKARPKSQFNASVNFGSSNFNRYNPVTIEDHLTNTFKSSVGYSTTFGERFSFTSTLEHSQNTSNKTVTVTLPSISLSANRFYPLRPKGKSSDLAWYENISVGYNMKAKNEITTPDSLLFTNDVLSRFKNGVQHSVPIALTLKVLKYFTLTPSIDFNERWYSQSIRQKWVDDTLFTKTDTIVGYVATDTISGFHAIHEYSYGSTLNTKLYGLLQFKKGPLRAIRHVVSPSVGIRFRPDFGEERFGYYRNVQSDTAGTITRYSIYGGSGTNFSSIYGTPPVGKSGSVSFSISNNLEMKVRSKSDTITGTKKVMLIERLSLSTSYDLAKDSLKWAPLSLNASTKLFKRLTIQYNALFDPYVRTDNGKRIDEFEWKSNKRLFRKENSSWNFSLSYSFNSEKTSKGSNAAVVAPSAQVEEILRNPDDYINWNNPWSFNVNYNLVYNDRYTYNQGRIRDNSVVQTLGITGNVNITPKWKVDFRTGYDFRSNKLSHTSLNVYRDLHCWEMRFSWIPNGYLASWDFLIRVKADILQDLKLNRKKDFRDN